MFSEKTGRIVAGAAITLILVIGIILFFGVEVCEEQLPTTGDSGEPVRVCRSLEATDPPVLGVAVVLIGLVGAFYNEVSGFGITLKKAVQEAKESADKAAVGVRELEESKTSQVSAIQYAVRQETQSPEDRDEDASRAIARAGTSDSGTVLPESGGKAGIEDPDLRGAMAAFDYIDRTLPATPQELRMASELASRLKVGERLTPSEQAALFYSIRTTMDAYGEQLPLLAGGSQSPE